VRKFPMVPGVDLVGTVEDSADPDWRVGDQVVLNGWGVGETHWGCLAQRARLKGDWLVAMPQGLDARRAMAIGTAGYTAMLCVMALERRGVAPADGEVLVTGAAGGVGSVAIALLARAGYRVVASTGRAAEADYLRALGAAEVIDRRTFEFGTRALERPLWQGAVDSVGGEQLGWLVRIMQVDGVIAAFGNAGGVEFKGSVLPYILRGVRLIGVYANSPLPLRMRIWQRLATDLRPRHLGRIARRIRFDDLPQAFDDMMAAKIVGRMVVDFSLG